jgi:hypothetical protein
MRRLLYTIPTLVVKINPPDAASFVDCHSFPFYPLSAAKRIVSRNNGQRNVMRKIQLNVRYSARRQA